MTGRTEIQKAVWRCADIRGDVLPDGSGNDNHGRIQGAFRKTTGDPPGLFFNGWNALAEVPDSPSLDPGDSLVIETWVRPNSYGFHDTIVCKEDAFRLEFLDHGRLRFAFEDSKHCPYEIVSSERFPLNRWLHVLAAFDGFTLRIFVHGERKAEGSNAYFTRDPEQVAVSCGPVMIGGRKSSRYPTPCRFFCGDISGMEIRCGSVEPDQARRRYASDPRSRRKPGLPRRPSLEVQGTILMNTVEAAPFVWNGKLYLLYSDRTFPGKGFRCRMVIRDMATGQSLPAFGEGYTFPCVHVEGGTVHVFGTPGWGAPELGLFRSTDLATWEFTTAVRLPGWMMYNTSVCRTDRDYILAVDVGKSPENLPQRLSYTRFLRSEDLVSWKLAPVECVHSTDYYTAATCSHWADGWFYAMHLRELSDTLEFHTYIARSRDLVHWEESPVNPMLVPSEADRLPAVVFSEQDRRYLEETLNNNASDLDLCEFEGKTHLFYSRDDQRALPGVARMNLAHAIHRGPLNAFLRSFLEE